MESNISPDLSKMTLRESSDGDKDAIYTTTQHSLYGAGYAQDAGDATTEKVKLGHLETAAPPPCEWLHGQLERGEATRLLLTNGKPGSYLVRKSVWSPGDYILTFRTNSGIRHFKILQDFGSYYLGNDKFPSLSAIIGFYHENFLSDDMCLEYPIPALGQLQEGAKVAVAEHDFVPQSDLELAFHKGDAMLVLNSSDPHWWWVRMPGGAVVDCSAVPTADPDAHASGPCMDCASPSVERSRPSTKRRPSIANILNRRRSSVELGQAADGRSPHGSPLLSMDSSGKSSPLWMKRSASDYADRLGRITSGCGREGYVPANHLQRPDNLATGGIPAFHGEMTSQEAADLLENRENGAFLIRESASDKGDYSLACRVHGRTRHFKIYNYGPGRFGFGGGEFASLRELVAHYTTDVPVYDNVFLGKGVELETQPPAETLYPCPPVPARKPPEPRSETVPVLPCPRPSDTPTFRKTGWLTRRGKKPGSWKMTFAATNVQKRRLYLFASDGLSSRSLALQSLAQSVPKVGLKPKIVLDLSACTITMPHTSLLGRPNCIQVTQRNVKDCTVYLCADTADQRADWVNELRSLCDPRKFAKNCDEHRKLSVQRIAVTIWQAKDVGAKYRQVYCLLRLGQIPFARTLVHTVSRSGPGTFYWDEKFSFFTAWEFISDCYIDVYAKVTQYHMLSKDMLLGSVKLPAGLVDGARTHQSDNWHTVLSPSGSAMGKLRVSMDVSHERWLSIEAYTKLYQLVMDPSAQYVISMGALGTERDELAQAVLALHQGEGRQGALVNKLCAAELANCGVCSEVDTNTIFRGNTLATKCMEQLMHTVGALFLHECRDKAVADIAAQKLSCEVDPSKVPKAEQTDRAQAERVRRLIVTVEAVWKSIHEHASACPMYAVQRGVGLLHVVAHGCELRITFGALKQDILAKFPGEVQVARTAIAGFIFLRYFCLAITYPRKFNIAMNEPLSAQTERTLLLVAKSIQTLANNLSSPLTKEDVLSPINDFLAANAARMTEYIDELSAVPPSPSTFITLPRIRARAELATIFRWCQIHLQENPPKETTGPLAQVAAVIRELEVLTAQAYEEESVYVNIDKLG